MNSWKIEHQYYRCRNLCTLWPYFYEAILFIDRLHSSHNTFLSTNREQNRLCSCVRNKFLPHLEHVNQITWFRRWNVSSELASKLNLTFVLFIYLSSLSFSISYSLYLSFSHLGKMMFKHLYHWIYCIIIFLAPAAFDQSGAASSQRIVHWPFR